MDRTPDELVMQPKFYPNAKQHDRAGGRATQRLGHAAKRWEDPHQLAKSSGVNHVLEPRTTTDEIIRSSLRLLELQLVRFRFGLDRVTGGKLAFQYRETERVQ
jgi:hypothetical protein